MTTQYYAPPDHIQASHLVLPAPEARHALKALRKQAGNEVIVVDGEGGWYRVALQEITQQEAIGVILERRHNVGEPATSVHIGLALLKNTNRFELFLEKAVELGVTHITPLLTNRTERTRLRMERARNILIAAMKQCGRCRLPHLSEPKPLTELWAGTSTDALRLIAHETTAPKHHLGNLVPATIPIHVLIGPEGGFTPAEMEQAQTHGWKSISLGPRRLRAETAALTVAAILNIYNH